MSRMTAGNHLFFYQLFSTQLGVGRQTALSRIEEVLAEADVLLDDVECESVEELLEALSDFMKVTTFKKGRVFATVMPQEDLDNLLERADQPTVDRTAAQAGKSWKHNRRSKATRPIKPRHRRKPVVERAKEEAAPAGALRAATEDQAAASAGALGAVGEPMPGTPEGPAFGPGQIPEPEPLPKPKPEPTQELAPEPEPEPEPGPETLPEPEPAQEPGPEPGPLPEPEPELDPEPGPKPKPAPEPQPARNPQRVRASARLRRIGMPTSISRDVFCPDELLRKIYQSLPQTRGLLDTLDESWEFANEAGTMRGTRTRITFPLSRAVEGEPPIEVTIQRATRLPANKFWKLTSVDTGNEGPEGTGG